MRRRRPSEGAGGGASGGGGSSKGVDQPATSRQRTTLFGFAGFSSRSSSGGRSGSSTLPSSASVLLPQWGRLIDDCCVRAARLRRVLQSTGPAPPPGVLSPAPRRHFTIPFASPFNDGFNRTPGQGSAGAYGPWGSGVRSALNRGSLGLVARGWGSNVAGDAMLLIAPGAADEEEDGEEAVGEGSNGSSSSSSSSGDPSPPPPQPPQPPPPPPQQQQQQQQQPSSGLPASSSFASSGSTTTGAGGDTRRAGKAKGRGSHHSRNFNLIATWALEGSGGLVEDANDVATLRTLLHEYVLVPCCMAIDD